MNILEQASLYTYARVSPGAELLNHIICTSLLSCFLIILQRSCTDVSTARSVWEFLCTHILDNACYCRYTVDKSILIDLHSKCLKYYNDCIIENSIVYITSSAINELPMPTSFPTGGKGTKQPKTLSLPEIFQSVHSHHDQVLELENILEIILSSSIL